jgi:hypothetical protein
MIFKNSSSVEPLAAERFQQQLAVSFERAIKKYSISPVVDFY